MITYKPFLKLLIDKNLKKRDLVNAGIMSWATMAKIEKNQYVALRVIDDICKLLKCQPGDIIDWIPDNQEKKAK